MLKPMQTLKSIIETTDRLIACREKIAFLRTLKTDQGMRVARVMEDGSVDEEFTKILDEDIFVSAIRAQLRRELYLEEFFVDLLARDGIDATEAKEDII